MTVGDAGMPTVSTTKRSHFASCSKQFSDIFFFFFFRLCHLQKLCSEYGLMLQSESTRLSGCISMTAWMVEFLFLPALWEEVGNHSTPIHWVPCGPLPIGHSDLCSTRRSEKLDHCWCQLSNAQPLCLCDEAKGTSEPRNKLHPFRVPRFTGPPHRNCWRLCYTCTLVIWIDLGHLQ